MSFLIEIQSQKIQLTQLKIQYSKEINNMNVICGISDTNTYVLTLPVINENKKTEINASPLFLQFRIDSLKIANEKL